MNAERKASQTILASPLFWGTIAAVSMVAIGHEVHAQTLDALPEMPPLGDLSNVSLEAIDQKIAALSKLEQESNRMIDVWKHIAELDHKTGAPVGMFARDFKELEATRNYYRAMHEQLVALRPDVARADGVQASMLVPDYRQTASANRIRHLIEGMQTYDQRSFSPRELRIAQGVLHEYETLLNTARPGTVLSSSVNPVTHQREWIPLSVSMGSGVSRELPLSTARALEDLRNYLKQDLALDTPLGTVDDPAATARLTEGSRGVGSGLTYKHATGSGHYDGSSVDFATHARGVNGKYDSSEVAKVLARSFRFEDSHREVKLFFELSGKDGDTKTTLAQFQDAVAKHLVHEGYNLVDAEKIAQSRIRLVGNASAQHFHMDSVRPPVYAPSVLVASK